MRRFIATSLIAVGCVGLVISASVADLTPELPVQEAETQTEDLTVTDEAPTEALDVLEAPATEEEMTLTQCNGCGCGAPAAPIQQEFIGQPCGQCGEVIVGDQYGAPYGGEQFIGGEQIIGEQVIGEQIVGDPFGGAPVSGYAPSYGYSGGGGFGGGGGGGGFGGGGSLLGLAGLGLGIGALAVAVDDDDTVAAPASP